VVALGFVDQRIQAAGADVRVELTVPLGRVVVDEPPAEARHVSSWETCHGGRDLGYGSHGEKLVLSGARRN
jgi:hypothetical protein